MHRLVCLLTAICLAGELRSQEIAPPAVSTNTASAGLPSGYLIDDKHQLRPGDAISFRITEDRDKGHKLVIADSGELEVPYIGRVRAAGKSCKELAGEIKGLLEQEYYYRATIIIGLDSTERVRSRIFIWGQVAQQGAIELPANGSLTVGKAILLAGGFANFANKSKVRLMRKIGADDAKETIELNLTDILEKGQIEKDVVLWPDDLIFVPARLVNF